MAKTIPGLHHVTAIASDPQRNLDFYVGLLGLRFVKRTVNFDDPGTYHFYFGDQICAIGSKDDDYVIERIDPIHLRAKHRDQRRKNVRMTRCAARAKNRFGFIDE
jgi:catechol 2,3-dioxygenase-like lactoylglutathione lyase family enzyme